MLALAPGLARAGKGRSLTVDRSPNPDVLEVVPWSYGFAHSWTWKWLLEQKELAPLGSVRGGTPIARRCYWHPTSAGRCL